MNVALDRWSLTGTANVAESLGGRQEDAAVAMLRAWRAGRLGRKPAVSPARRRCFGYWVSDKGYDWLEWLDGLGSE